MFLASGEGDVHLCERLVGEFHHLVHVFVLVGGEILFFADAPVDASCDVVAGVADTLYL